MPKIFLHIQSSLEEQSLVAHTSNFSIGEAETERLLKNYYWELLKMRWQATSGGIKTFLSLLFYLVYDQPNICNSLPSTFQVQRYRKLLYDISFVF